MKTTFTNGVSEINAKFATAKSIEELRSIYKELAKQFHPDKGGDVETMQFVNARYDQLCKKFENPNDGDENISELYKEVIEKLINFDEIEIEIVGTWIWISGNTYPIKAQLKEAGALWSGQRKMWYFRSGEFKWRKKSNETADFSTLREMFGSRIVKKSDKLKLK